MPVPINIANGGGVSARPISGGRAGQSGQANRARGATGNPAPSGGAGPKLVKVRAKEALFCVMLDG